MTAYSDFLLLLQPADTQKPLYEIRFGTELLGTIVIPEKYGNSGSAVSADGEWTFHHEGFTSSRIVIKDQSNDMLASFQPNLFNQAGILTIKDGQNFSIKMSFFQNTLDVYAQYDEHCIHFQNYGIIRFRSDITILRSSRRIKHFPLIFFACCYILLTKRNKPAH